MLYDSRGNLSNHTGYFVNSIDTIFLKDTNMKHTLFDCYERRMMIMIKMTLKEKIGQMIMTGFQSSAITPEILELITEYKISNIILFSYNLEYSKQIYELCKKLDYIIRESTGYPALIAVDQEGGVVSRLPKEMNNIPGAMLIGATDKEEYAYRAGAITGEELRALGINMDLAPVLDVNNNPNNPVIGVRSYSSDPYKVARFGVNMMKGLHSAGVMSTIKHFPGHGDTAVDSHLGLPVIKKELDQLMECELIPFIEAIKEGAPCVMSSHILFPKLEKENKPATMSKAILTDLLRHKLGFKGIIMTDCMEMGAIKDYYGTAKGAVEALKAGAQIITVSHTPQLVKETIHLIEEGVKKGEIPIELIDEAVENILKYKNTYKNSLAISNLEPTYSVKYRNEISKITEEGIVKVTPQELPIIKEDTIFISPYAYQSTLASSAVNKGLHFAKYMSGKFGGTYFDIPINPDQLVIEDILKQVNKKALVVCGLYNGHMNNGQIELVNHISENGNTVIAITLRNPSDLALLHDDVHKIAGFEYNETVFEAIVNILKKEIDPIGKLPVQL